ncbi:MAG TPA: hypothetical protein PKO07_20185, partial [Pseudomonadota bacterium]|nr:hypothetical protein [Pseudomonadota bacterium]
KKTRKYLLHYGGRFTEDDDNLREHALDCSGWRLGAIAGRDRLTRAMHPSGLVGGTFRTFTRDRLVIPFRETLHCSNWLGEDTYDEN